MPKQSSPIDTGETARSSGLKTHLHQLCKNCQKILALPESDDPRTLRAARLILDAAACRKIVLFGSSEKVYRTDKNLSIGLDQYSEKIIFAEDLDPAILENTKIQIGEVFSKKQKKISEEKLSKMAGSFLNQAGYLLSKNLVDAVVAGANNSTADVIRAGITMVGLEKGLKTVSGAFILEREETVFLFSDAAVVVEPTSDQLSDIASASVKTWKSILDSREEPAVAFLSFSTKGSARHPAADKVIEAFDKFKEKNPDIICDGEIQFDAAFDLKVGSKKAPGSPIPGKTNIFIFPNLDSGNLGYKIAQRLGGFKAYGPILQGLRLPYCDLSRGATAEDIAMTSYIALLKSIR